jgi:hypothetical protein
MLPFVGLCLPLLFALDGMAIGVTHRNGLVEPRLSWLTHHYPPPTQSVPSTLWAIRTLWVLIASDHDFFQNWIRFGLRETLEISPTLRLSLRSAK